MLCAQAVVGLTDRIFTRIASQEATALGQSQFMLDLSQIASMLRSATGRCVRLHGSWGVPQSPLVGLVVGRPQPVDPSRLLLDRQHVSSSPTILTDRLTAPLNNGNTR